MILSEDPLFFGDRQYPLQFHPQKLMLYRASMRQYARQLRSRFGAFSYSLYVDGESRLQTLFDSLAGKGVTQFVTCDVVDDVLARRVETFGKQHAIKLLWPDNLGLSAPRSRITTNAVKKAQVYGGLLSLAAL